MCNLNNFKSNFVEAYELDSNSSRRSKIMLVNVSTSSLKKVDLWANLVGAAPTVCFFQFSND